MDYFEDIFTFTYRILEEDLNNPLAVFGEYVSDVLLNGRYLRTCKYQHVQTIIEKLGGYFHRIGYQPWKSNHCWTNEKVTVKVYRQQSWFAHEVKIYLLLKDSSIKIPILYEVLEHKSDDNNIIGEGEFILIMENVGQSIADLYYTKEEKEDYTALDCGILDEKVPKNILNKINEYLTELDRLGYEHNDKHAGNFTIKNGDVYMIDLKLIERKDTFPDSS